MPDVKFTSKDIAELKKHSPDDFGRRCFVAFDSEGRRYRMHRLDAEHLKLEFALGRNKKTYLVTFDDLARDFFREPPKRDPVGSKVERKDAKSKTSKAESRPLVEKA